MIKRTAYKKQMEEALKRSRAVALLGPRQCGKTTVAREIVESTSPNYFDLEDPRHVRQLEQPMTAMESLKGVVVLDEVQRVPELFPVLRVLADRVPLPAKFLILGSASPALLKQTSESLAGRIAPITMSNNCWIGSTEAAQTKSGRPSLNCAHGLGKTCLIAFSPGIVWRSSGPSEVLASTMRSDMQRLAIPRLSWHFWPSRTRQKSSAIERACSSHVRSERDSSQDFRT